MDQAVSEVDEVSAEEPPVDQAVSEVDEVSADGASWVWPLWVSPDSKSLIDSELQQTADQGVQSINGNLRTPHSLTNGVGCESQISDTVTERTGAPVQNSHSQ